MATKCPLCDDLMHDSQTFYVCASNAKSNGSTIRYRCLAVASQCCFKCHRSMRRRETVAYWSAGTAAMVLVSVLLVRAYRIDWFIGTHMRWALLIVAVAACTAWGMLSTKTARRVGGPEMQALAEHMARTLDLDGKPAVFPKSSRPAGNCLILEPYEHEARDNGTDQRGR